MSQEDLLIILAVVAVVVFIIGILIGKALGSGRRVEEAKQKVEAAEKELADYKASVSQHFGQTADLIDDLTQSYKAVFEHLGSSARHLLTEEEVKQHLQSRASKAVTLTYLADESISDSNPMVQAQAEIQSETIVDEVEAEAEQMATAIHDSSEKQTTTAQATADNNTDVAKKTAELIAKDKATVADKAAAADKIKNDKAAKSSTDTSKDKKSEEKTL
ncbi:MAG: hypothetical protein CSA44_00670 [Gammaproteobacteria bacterium]|nr:MAG: hypothetical protein CSA44_00670 [Gammaproteobacteria bacterium]